MAAINSLTYLLYSVLTLAANNKPASDPSLNAWQIDQEPPVTEWNQESHYDPLNYDLNSNGCPNGLECKEYCTRIGFAKGGCAGPGHKWCICSKRIFPRDPEIPRVDPDETVSAEKDPEIPDGKLNAFGCPSDVMECDATCMKLGFGGGMCDGTSNLTCSCYPSWAKEEKKFQGVDPDETVSAEKDPEIPNGKFQGNGCPVERNCLDWCRRRKYGTGHCIGNDKSFCRCG